MFPHTLSHSERTHVHASGSVPVNQCASEAEGAERPRGNASARRLRPETLKSKHRLATPSHALAPGKWGQNNARQHMATTHGTWRTGTEQHMWSAGTQALWRRQCICFPHASCESDGAGSCHTSELSLWQGTKALLGLPRLAPQMFAPASLARVLACALSLSRSLSRTHPHRRLTQVMGLSFLKSLRALARALSLSRAHIHG